MRKRGFSIVELLIVMGVFTLLVGFVALNFLGLKTRTSLSTSVTTLISDLKSEQIKAMSGDATGGSLNLATYSFGDFVTANPASTITFAKVSGETTPITIVLTNSQSGDSKTIGINKLGVVYYAQ